MNRRTPRLDHHFFLCIEHPQTQVFIFVIQKEIGVEAPSAFVAAQQPCRSTCVAHTGGAFRGCSFGRPGKSWPTVVHLWFAITVQQLWRHHHRVGQVVRGFNQAGHTFRSDDAIGVEQQRIGRVHRVQSAVVGCAKTQVGIVDDQPGPRHLPRHFGRSVIGAGVVHDRHMRQCSQSTGQRRQAMRAVVGHDNHRDLIQTGKIVLVGHVGKPENSADCPLL